MSRILPGFANVHSHAFQRGLRGLVQERDPTREDTFWTWRERMYALAQGLSLAETEALARLCYVECLEAGYTAVGEFHYLHHDRGGVPYEDGVASARALLRAARQVGVRITLLWTVYARGGFDRDLSEAQQRFAVKSLGEVWRALDALSTEVDGVRSRLGLALHSVRAVPCEWLAPLVTEARSRGLPIHAHVSEQQVEVSACRAATGLSPVALLAREGVLGPDFTAVHATWLDEHDIELLADSGSGVALCPTTEGDLADGVPKSAALHQAGVPLSIGSDSHAVIDPFSELRFAEYQARAATGGRCVLTDSHGRVAPILARIGHEHGYRALGLSSKGDQLTLMEQARCLEGVGDAWQVAALMAGHPGLIDEVCVMGETLVRRGRHIDQSL